MTFPELGRDLFQLDIDGSALDRITQYQAHEINPILIDDDNTVMFASDHSGIFDIYQQALDTHLRRRLTRILTGAKNRHRPKKQDLFMTIVTVNGSNTIAAKPLHEPDAERTNEGKRLLRQCSQLIGRPA